MQLPFLVYKAGHNCCMIPGVHFAMSCQVETMHHAADASLVEHVVMNEGCYTSVVPAPLGETSDAVVGSITALGQQGCK